MPSSVKWRGLSCVLKLLTVELSKVHCENIHTKEKKIMNPRRRLWLRNRARAAAEATSEAVAVEAPPEQAAAPAAEPEAPQKAKGTSSAPKKTTSSRKSTARKSASTKK
jgi:hypothetical protein